MSVTELDHIRITLFRFRAPLSWTFVYVKGTKKSNFCTIYGLERHWGLGTAKIPEALILSLMFRSQEKTPSYHYRVWHSWYSTLACSNGFPIVADLWVVLLIVKGRSFLRWVFLRFMHFLLSGKTKLKGLFCPVFFSISNVKKTFDRSFAEFQSN